MNTDEIQQLFESEEIITEISCKKAFELAEKHNLEMNEIAKYCNQNNIKIRSCQLGCFK